ncbi:MAG TPA: OsmC family peroxiredoxin [Gaiellaceae bacterium]|jgi:osmotically inducible protein OsmC|nr:OsmC family peroxiredoxin [Gaiellaceae bacterium]
MPRIERSASVSWEGTTARGTGLASGDTGSFTDIPFSLPSRLNAQSGKTSPEELLAAAHGGCLTMSLATELSRAGLPPERLDTSVRIVMDEVPGQGHLVVGSEVEIAARVPGLEQERLDELVETADAGCPFSALLRASASVTVRARLAT